MKLQNKTILIISNEPWSEIWYSKHNWAWELSKSNIVFFINPAPKWKIKNLFTNNVFTEKITETLSVVNYNNRLPGNENNKIIFNLNNLIISKKINRFLDKLKCKNIIFWSFDPYRLVNPALLNCDFSIFHIADKYTNKSFPNLIKNSDSILCVSPEFESISGVSEKPYLILNHAIPDDFFHLDHEVSLPSCYTGEKNLLFVGSVDFRLDFELIEFWANRFSDLRFIFVGPILYDNLDDSGKRIFIEKKYRNIISSGPVPFRQLKNYIAYADVNIAPMKMTVHGNLINHQKLLQYLAWGKPVVCPPFSDFKEHRDLLYEYTDNNSSLDALRNAINESKTDHLMKERINFAKGFSFSKQFAKIEELISKNAHLIRNSK